MRKIAVTVSITKGTESYLINKGAELMKKTGSSWSLSKVANCIIEYNIKHEIMKTEEFVKLNE